MTRRCSKCRQEKPVDAFYVARREKSGRMSECIDCMRLRRGNTPLRPQPTCLADLYERAALSTNGCREWTGHRSGGYGKVALNGGQVQVHRAAYAFAHGPIPEGMQIHHKCGNRACVEVGHLELLTASEHSLLHNLGADVDTCRKGHTGDWYLTPAGHRRCRECVRIRRRRRYAEGIRS